MNDKSRFSLRRTYLAIVVVILLILLAVLGRILGLPLR